MLIGYIRYHQWERERDITVKMAVMDSLTQRFSSSKWPMIKQRQRTATNTVMRSTCPCSSSPRLPTYSDSTAIVVVSSAILKSQNCEQQMLWIEQDIHAQRERESWVFVVGTDTWEKAAWEGTTWYKCMWRTKELLSFCLPLIP